MQISVNVKQIGNVNTFINRIIGNINDGVANAMPKVGQLVTREAQFNAPHLTGDLARSISYNAFSKSVEIGVNPATKAGQYAARREYEEYNYGAGTLAKGQRAGNFYLQRAVKDNIKNIKKILARNIRSQF